MHLEYYGAFYVQITFSDNMEADSSAVLMLMFFQEQNDSV